MKIRIVQGHKRIDGMIGDVIEVEPSFGHYLAGIGKAVIVEHDKPGKKNGGCVVRNTPGVIQELRDESDQE